MQDVYITIAAQIVAFIVWIARIEMRLRFLEQTHEKCNNHRMAVETTTQNKLDSIFASIAEIKTDIKWLVHKKKGDDHDPKVL